MTWIYNFGCNWIFDYGFEFFFILQLCFFGPVCKIGGSLLWFCKMYYFEIVFPYIVCETDRFVVKTIIPKIYIDNSNWITKESE